MADECPRRGSSTGAELLHTTRSARNELEIMDGAPAGSPLSCSHSGVLGEAIRAVLSNAGIETSQVPFAAEERNKMQE